jgi:hypothetical protein
MLRFGWLVAEWRSSPAEVSVPDLFSPRLDILPPPQRRLWDELGEVPPEFVLYGGTAIALSWVIANPRISISSATGLLIPTI